MGKIKKGMRSVKRNGVIISMVRSITILTMIVSLVTGVLNGRMNSDDSHYFMNAFTCLVLLIVTFVPSFLLNRKILIILPAALQTGFVVFSFLAIYFGEIFHFYSRFKWWDVMLHSSSAFMLGIAGYLLLYSLNEDYKVSFHLSPRILFVFSFCFAMAVGAVWEVFEYGGDYLLGMNMQKSVYLLTEADKLAYFETYIHSSGRVFDPGLVDTMKDIIVDAIGALSASLLGYVFMKRNKSITVDVENNEILIQ